MCCKLFSDSGIQTAHIMTRLFYMQHRCILVNFFAKAKGLNFAVKTNRAAAQLQLLKAQKSLLNCVQLTFYRRILSFMLVAPTLAKFQALAHISKSNRLVHKIRMRLTESIIMVLLPMQLTSAQSRQLFPQINIIPIITVILIFQSWHNFFKALFGKIINTVHFKRLALMLLTQLLNQQR